MRRALQGMRLSKSFMLALHRPQAIYFLLPFAMACMAAI